MSKKLFRNASLVASSLVLLMSSSVFAADGKELFTSKGCVACHGADAKTPTAPIYPNLAGQNKEYLVQQLKDLKSGDRSNAQAAIMKGILGAVNEEEITALSEYLSSL